MGLGQECLVLLVITLYCAHRGWKTTGIASAAAALTMGFKWFLGL